MTVNSQLFIDNQSLNTFLNSLPANKLISISTSSCVWYNQVFITIIVVYNT